MAAAAERTDAVVAKLYEAVSCAPAWTDAVRELAALLRGFDGQLLAAGRDGSAFLGEPLPTSMAGQADYLSHWGRRDVRRALVDRQPAGAIVSCAQHFDESFVRRNALYQEYLIPNGWRYAAGGWVSAESGTKVYLAVHRLPEQGPFEPADLDLLAHVASHLGRAARLHFRFSEARAMGDALARALDRLPQAAFVLDANARIFALNRAAEEILARRDGLSARDGRLDATRPEAASALLRLLSEATGAARTSRGGGCRIPRSSSPTPYAVEVMPLLPWSVACAAWQRPLTLVLVVDPERRAVPLGRRLVEIFRLTPAEARLAVALAEGKRLAEVAAERGVGMPTVRSQLQAVLRKTGTRRQAELAGLLAQFGSGPARC